MTTAPSTMPMRLAFIVLGMSTLSACWNHPRPVEHAASTSKLPGGTVIPTRYDEHRWIVRPVTTDGDTLDLYTDSGGGFQFIARERLGITVIAFVERTPAGDSMFTAPWPTFRTGQSIPAPRFVTPPTVTMASLATFRRQAGQLPGRDGFLGNAWFAGRVWTFDYPSQRLTLIDNAETPIPLDGHTIPLGFKNPPTGGDAPWFPRVSVVVDGDSLDLLFDTGATTVLTDSALAVIADGHRASRAASFITRTVFERWQTRHPEWRVVRHAETTTGADMIQVPALEIAGLTATAVWFTARPDRAFTEYMSQWMDRPIVGALGGSGLREFRVTVDYPGRRATLLRPDNTPQP